MNVEDISSTGWAQPALFCAPTISLRVVDTAEQLAGVNTVVRAALRSWRLPERVYALSLGSFLYTEHDLGHMRIVIAEHPLDGPLGVAASEPGAGRDLPPGRRGLLLHGIYAIPAAQRQGLGRRLIDRVARDAQSLGLDGISVRAWREAQAFFLRLGFAPFDADESVVSSPRRLWRALS